MDDPTQVHDFFVVGDSGPIYEVVVYVKDGNQYLLKGGSGGSGSAQANCDFLASRAPDPGVAWRYIFTVPQGWDNQVLAPHQYDIVGPGNIDQGTYDELTRDARYVCTVQATSKGPTSSNPQANPPAGPQQEAVVISLDVTGQGQSQVAAPCGQDVQNIQAPYDVLVTVTNRSNGDDTFQTTVLVNGGVVATKSDAIPAGGQQGYTVQIQSGGTVEAKVSGAGGGTAQCSATVILATTPPPQSAPPPQSGGGGVGGPPSQGYYGPAGLVPVPSLGVAIPVGGGQTYLVGSRAKQALARIGLLKVK